MFDYNEKKLLKIIRYYPSLFITTMGLIVILFLYVDNKNNLVNEKKNIEQNFINNNKEIIRSQIETLHSYIINQKQSTEVKLKKSLKENVNLAHKLASTIYKENINKPEKEIKKLIKDAIRTIRFNDGRGYFFIHDKSSFSNTMHPIMPQLEGKNSYYVKDAKGIYIIRDMHKLLKEKDETFYTWYWYKPSDKTKQYKKIGYLKNFKPFNWFIATGEYVDNYEEKIKNEVLEYIENTKFINSGYTFVVNYEGKILSHAKKSLINTTLFELEAQDLFNKFSNLDETNPFVSYSLKTSNKKTEKTSYIKKIEDWSWIIGTGFHYEDMKEIISKKQNELEKRLEKNIKNIILISLSLISLLLLISFYISKRLQTYFLNYKNNIKEYVNKNNEQKDLLLEAQKIANIANWELDINTNRVYLSSESLNIFGLKEQENSFGIDFMKELISENEFLLFENSLNDAIKYNKEHKIIYRLKNDSKWIDSRGKIDINRNIFIGTIQDISENKRLELERNEKIELLNKQSKMASMGEMLSNIAHQWRQPLSAISTAATGAKLQKEMDMLSDKDFIASMESINNSAQFLSQTIEDFRNFCNPENKKIETFQISNTINKTLNLINSQFLNKNIKIVKNIEDYKLTSFENELLQVLLNLFNNSKDALLINKNEQRLIIVSTYKKDESFYIDIIDNGNGINEDIIDRVFEPYFTTKHQSQGTGIGLYMSQEIIKNSLKGELSIKNERFYYEEKEFFGAKFTIMIPTATKDTTKI